MNQLRGERRGAGVTGKPRGRAEGRTFAISRLAAHSWHSWDSQEFASFWSPEEADGTLRGTAEPLRSDMVDYGKPYRLWSRCGEHPGTAASVAASDPERRAVGPQRV